MSATASGVIDIVRQETDWSGGTDATILALLNRTFKRIQREHDFTFQEQVATRTLTTAASGFSRFAQPTDCKGVKTLYFIESSERIELDYMDYVDTLTEFPDPSKTGKPEVWSLFRDEIYLFPSLASAVAAEVFYYRFLPDFTATSSNDFLVWGEDALIYGTKREYYGLIGETTKAQAEQALLADAVSSLLKYHNAAKQRPIQSTVMRTPGTTVSSRRSSRINAFRNDRW